jgi:hypothetical protein
MKVSRMMRRLEKVGRKSFLVLPEELPQEFEVS